MNSGKKTRYIDSNNYLESTNEENFSSERISYEIPDSIRYYSKNYWTVSEDKLINARVTSNDIMFDTRKIDENTIELVANKSKFVSDSINSTGILERKFNKSLWEQFVKGIIPSSNTLFEDCYIQFPEPKNISEDKTIENALNYINKEFIYNFYSQKYENLLNDRRLNVVTLPNVFSLISDPNLGTRTYEENLTLTLGGLIPDDYAEALFLAKDNSQIVQDYFNIYSDTYKDPNSRTVIDTLSTTNNVLKIKNDKLLSLKTLKYVPFPFYVETKFSNLANSNNNFIHELENIGNVKEDLQNYLISDQNNDNTKNFIYESDVLEQKTLKQFDLKAWIDNGLSGFNDYVSSDDASLLARTTTTFSTVEYTNLIEYIKNNIKNKKRSYEEFSNKEAHIEPLYYKIEKRQFNYDRAEPIQTFWVSPNTDDAIKIIDAQVKYATEYYYTITCFTLVIGNQYSYEKYDYSNKEEERLQDISDGIYKLKVNNNTLYKILEIPFARFTGAVHEAPYTKPEVKIEQDDNNIRINLKQSSLDNLEEFQIIENKDFSLFESIRLSQDNEDPNKIKSKINKNNNNILEIYKIANKPINYLSFQSKLYKTVELNNTNSFTDSLVTNIKYYYLFRFLNNHNTPSNVSKIYEVELKNEDGYVYLVTNEVDLEKTSEKTLFKNMKRYLLLRPSVIQTQVNMKENFTTVDDVVLGPDTQTVWGKDFILRLTSKKSNRILEFNLKPIINRQKD
jgi:hypothetical protein